MVKIFFSHLVWILGVMLKSLLKVALTVFGLVVELLKIFLLLFGLVAKLFLALVRAGTP